MRVGVCADRANGTERNCAHSAVRSEVMKCELGCVLTGLMELEEG